MKFHLHIPAYFYLFATLQLRYPHNYQLSIHLLPGGDYLLYAGTILIETFAFHFWSWISSIHQRQLSYHLELYVHGWEFTQLWEFTDKFDMRFFQDAYTLGYGFVWEESILEKLLSLYFYSLLKIALFSLSSFFLQGFRAFT